jgi:phosphoribosyl-ATP pyrophosphohydrolase
MTQNNLEFLSELEQILRQRAEADPGESYTATLLQKGQPYIAQKLGEEAVELVIAGVQADADRIVAEAADLLYHLLVLLQSHDLQLADIVAELKSRHR